MKLKFRLRIVWIDLFNNKRGEKMNENIDFVGSNEPLTGDVAIYGALFDDFLQDHIAKGQINPEITNPILKAYNVSVRNPASCLH